MPVIAATRSLPSAAAPTRAIVYGALASLGFIGGGLLAAAMILSAGILDGSTGARPSAFQMAVGVAAWAFALIVPGVFVILGMTRLVDTVELILRRREQPRPASRLASVLGDEHAVATRVRLPDGRVIPELVVGPFGAAVVEELPPPSISRHKGGRWELQVGRGRWMPIENPLDRATRDAERVRAWLAHEDHDHVVKVYAAVVDPDGTLPRSSTCAVVRPDELGAWLGALPAQRSLFPDRRARLVELMRAAVV